jgi:hypothetical protein
MMKLALSILVAMLASTTASAAVDRIDVPTFTPREWATAPGASPWAHIGDTESTSYWYSYAVVQGQVFVGIKNASIGIGKNYTSLGLTTGSLACGPSGDYPDSMTESHAGVYSPVTGIRMDDGDGPFGAETPITRNTALARIVVKVCDAVRR